MADKVLTIDDYRPGKALNAAIESCTGENIAVLSAHTLPSNDHWLENLFLHQSRRRLAGIYGAQLYPINSRFLDKRDLDIFSSTKPRIETQDSDFWNANSLFSRQIWEAQAFDETVFELEDHYWTKQVLPRGYHVHFEPRALVYHYNHIDRVDREYLEPSPLSDAERIENAIATLNVCSSDWPHTMRAGLTLNSLTHVKEIVQAVPAIGNTLLSHPDFDVRWRMAQALGKIPCELSADYLVRAMLEDVSFYPRDEAAWALGRLGHTAVPLILKNRDRFTPETLPFAALALGKSGQRDAEEKAIEILAAELESGDKERQKNAAYFAGELAGIHTSSTLIAYLNNLLESASEDSLHVYCWALGCFAERCAHNINWGNVFEVSVGHQDVLVRFEATVAIGKRVLGCPSVADLAHLLDQMNDSASRVRYGAIQSIRLMLEQGMQVPLPASLEFWDDEDFGVMYEKCLIRQLAKKL